VAESVPVRLRTWLITLPGQHKTDEDTHNDDDVYQFPGKVISSENRGQPGHGGKWVVCGVCANPLFTFTVNDYAVLNLAFLLRVHGKDFDVRAADLISTRDRSAPFKQDIIPIGLQLDVVRLAFLMNVSAWNIFVHWLDPTGGFLFSDYRIDGALTVSR